MRRAWHEIFMSVARIGTQAFDELLENVSEAVEGYLSVDASDVSVSDTDRVTEIAV